MSEEIGAESSEAELSSADLNETISEAVEDSSIGNEEESSDDIESLEGESLDEAEAALESEVEDAIEDGASEEEIQDMIDEFDLKVNGRTIKKKLPFKVPKDQADYMRRELQKSAAFGGMAQENSELKKLYDTDKKRFMENPWELMEEMGMDVEDMFMNRAQEMIKQNEMDPRELEMQRMEKKYNEMNQELENARQREEDAKFSQMKQQEIDRVSSEIEDAFSAHKTLPKNPKTVNRIIDALEWAEENGFKGASVQDVLPIVEEDIKRETQKFMSDLPDEAFEEYVTKQRLDKYRKNRLTSMKKKKPTVMDNIKATGKLQEEKEKPREAIDSRDYFRNLGK